MSFNIFIKPIEKTEEVAETTVYKLLIKVNDGEEQEVLFPQCLEEMSETNRKYLIQGILANHVQNPPVPDSEDTE